MHRSLIVTFGIALLVGCRDNSSLVTDMENSGAISPSHDIVDARNGGRAGFYFYSPIATSVSSYPGTPDLSQNAVVEICTWANGQCAQPLVRRYTRQSGIVLGTDHYRVDWPITGLSAGVTYRIRVLVEGMELGFADARVATATETATTLRAQGFVALGNAGQLPIRFRIEGAALAGTRAVQVNLAPGVSSSLAARIRRLCTPIACEAFAGAAVLLRMPDANTRPFVLAMNAQGEILLLTQAPTIGPALIGPAESAFTVSTIIFGPTLLMGTPLATVETVIRSSPRLEALRAVIQREAEAGRSFVELPEAGAIISELFTQGLSALPDVTERTQHSLLKPSGSGPANDRSVVYSNQPPIGEVAATLYPVMIIDGSSTSLTFRNDGYVSLTATVTADGQSGVSTETLKAREVKFFAIPPQFDPPHFAVLQGWNGRMRVTIDDSGEARQKNVEQAISAAVDMLGDVLGHTGAFRRADGSGGDGWGLAYPQFRTELLVELATPTSISELLNEPRERVPEALSRLFADRLEFLIQFYLAGAAGSIDAALRIVKFGTWVGALVTAASLSEKLPFWYSWLSIPPGDTGELRTICQQEGVLLDPSPANCRTPEPKPREGITFDDPHMLTTDGLYYEFHAVGDFVLSKAIPGEDDLEVQVRYNWMDARKTISMNEGMAARVAGDVVNFFPVGSDRYDVIINNELITGTSSLQRKLPGGGSVLVTNTEAAVSWPDGTVFKLRQPWRATLAFLPVSRSGRVEGLLGNSDGNSDNDLRTRSGVPVTQEQVYGEFRSSWRPPMLGSLFRRGVDPWEPTIPGTTTLAAADLDRARGICQTAGVVHPDVLNACAFDIAATGDDRWAQSAAAIDPARPRVTVLPALTYLNPGQTRQLSAVVNGDPMGMVTWSATGGSITVHPGNIVMYTAPVTPGEYTITATSSTASGTARVNVTAPALNLNIVEPAVAMTAGASRSIGITLRLADGTIPIPGSGSYGITLQSANPGCVNTAVGPQMLDYSFTGTLTHGGATPLPCTTTVTASVTGRPDIPSDQVTVTVNPLSLSLNIVEPSVAFTAGSSATISATLRLSDGTMPPPGSSFELTLRAADPACVSASSPMPNPPGFIYPVVLTHGGTTSLPCTTTVTASVNGRPDIPSDEVTVTVNPLSLNLNIVEPAVSFTADRTGALTVTLRMSDGTFPPAGSTYTVRLTAANPSCATATVLPALPGYTFPAVLTPGGTTSLPCTTTVTASVDGHPQIPPDQVNVTVEPRAPSPAIPEANVRR